jgi:beta-1,4-mannosyltransferase
MLSPIAEPSGGASLERMKVLILVQGELAQSPRMLNHARALCDAGASVSLAGYTQLPLPEDITRAPKLSVRRISEAGAERLDSVPRAFYLPAAASKAARTTMWLAWLLSARIARFDVAIVQDPHALPALPLALLAARAWGARVIVDWQSRTASMLGLRIGRNHRVVRQVSRIEGWLARRASAHFAVSDAMRQDLRERFGIDAAVLHDRPRRRATPLNAEQRLAIIRRVLAARGLMSGTDDAFVLVSPTSFGTDEDLDMLLDALGLVARWSPDIPLLLFATGFGPLRPKFEARAREIATGNLRIVTGWLPETLYRDLLSAADLGISTHRSASGLDLPMKVVDMIEAGLPALVLDYGAVLAELVPPLLQPLMFTDARGLATRLTDLLNGEKLAALHVKMASEEGPLWSEEWRRVALPLIAGDDRTRD